MKSLILSVLVVVLNIITCLGQIPEGFEPAFEAGGGSPHEIDNIQNVRVSVL